MNDKGVYGQILLKGSDNNDRRLLNVKFMGIILSVDDGFYIHII